MLASWPMTPSPARRGVISSEWTVTGVQSLWRSRPNSGPCNLVEVDTSLYAS
jgi:hypothetical protein